MLNISNAIRMRDKVSGRQNGLSENHALFRREKREHEGRVSNMKENKVVTKVVVIVFIAALMLSAIGTFPIEEVANEDGEFLEKDNESDNSEDAEEKLKDENQ